MHCIKQTILQMSTSFFACLDKVNLMSVLLFHFKLYLLVNTGKLFEIFLWQTTNFTVHFSKPLKQDLWNSAAVIIMFLNCLWVKRSFMCLVITGSSSIDDNDSSENVAKEWICVLSNLIGLFGSTQKIRNEVSLHSISVDVSEMY